MNIQEQFGLNVKKIREELNWSQDFLSEKSTLHRTYISGIERGIRNPTIEIVEKLAIALGVPISEFFKDLE
jgi:transcriptional regulator with XRE-family HTH domain